MVNPALAPATIGAVGSAVLSTLTSGHCTAMVAAVELLFRVLVSLLEATLAVLLMPLVQSAAVVVVVKVMVRVLVGASVPKVQVSVVPPARVLGKPQAAASAPPTVQVCPELGKTSVRVTLVELPVPPAVTTML